MLEPESRQLFLDALRPPPGHVLDLAIGTTYSLDLLALMAAPVAFALFDRPDTNASATSDPIATLQALREHAARITLFCQAGQIAVPPEFRTLLVYLENSVYPVVPPRPDSIFHPKVWFLRYRQSDGDSIAYRLLCLSRNLTFDRSWDTILRLEGTEGDESRHPELARFTQSLLTMANPIRPVAPDRADAIRELGDQFARATWNLPAGFRQVRFWPLGDDGVSRWPFEGRRDRTLVISPFVTAGTLARLTKAHPGSILVSRPETLEMLGSTATRHLAERLVLSPETSGIDPTTDDEPGDDNADEPVLSYTESTAESSDRVLEGLHAKTYVADAGWQARLWTGSANATDAAFHGNVEFLVEFEGPKDKCGVQATIGDETNRQGLRNLTMPYEPANADPREPTDAELLADELDRLKRGIGGFHFTATCEPHGEDTWDLTLRGNATVTTVEPDRLDGFAATIRPVTLGQGSAARLIFNADGLGASFTVTEPSVTPYFVITLEKDDAEVRFLVVAELIDPPPHRTDRVLRSLLSNRADLIRFLLLLLGNVDDALASFSEPVTPGPASAPWVIAPGSDTLLEPLIRAYARNPERLHDIERVMTELHRAPEGGSILPERWNEIWEPIAAALVRDASQ